MDYNILLIVIGVGIGSLGIIGIIKLKPENSKRSIIYGNNKEIKNTNAKGNLFDRVEPTKEEYIALADSVFAIFNKPTVRYVNNRFSVKYIPDTALQLHRVQELYETTIIWEWSRKMAGKIEYEKEILERIKYDILLESITYKSMGIQEAINDPTNTEFQERLKELNKK